MSIFFPGVSVDYHRVVCICRRSSLGALEKMEKKDVVAWGSLRVVEARDKEPTGLRKSASGNVKVNDCARWWWN